MLVWTEAGRFPAMARFYRDTLGLTARSSKGDFINWALAGVRLSVMVPTVPTAPAPTPCAVMIHLAVETPVAVHARLTRAGVMFTRAPEREEWVAG